MAAIYTALTEQQIIYSTIPPGFEGCRQRVRLMIPCGTRERNLSGYGTALCFLASNPSAECPHRHHQRACFRRRLAGAGNLSGPLLHRRCIALTNQSAEGNYDIHWSVETTCMNMGHNVDFDNAVKSANGKLSDQTVSSSPSTSEGPGIRESARFAARTERTSMAK